MIAKKKRKTQHVDDCITLYKKYDLFSSFTPFEFKNEKMEQEFMVDFRSLGHSHIYFGQCVCNVKEV
jgi:hypothetical protein